jgi:hypothetical protein
MSGINGITVIFKGVYGCLTVALVRKLSEFYGCVTVVHLRHTLVRRIWTTHFSILIRNKFPYFGRSNSFYAEAVADCLEFIKRSPLSVD